MNRTTLRDPLAPFNPTATDPFDLRKAGHLLRRAAFGGSLEDRTRLVRLGADEAVSGLFEASGGEKVDDVLDDVIALGGLERVRSYRVWRMLRSGHPLRERMSLFWHDHFATSNQKVKNAGMMARQQATLDRLGLRRFDDLLVAVGRDPAMIRWLDNETNVRGHPNENYARELFELFTLGEGNYSEHDIREAARAFTGWHLKDDQFRFQRMRHDAGKKTIFGKSGRFGGEQVLAMAAEHPASAPFIARKLLGWFVHPTPTAAETAAVARLYTEKKRHIGETLRVLLRSELFFSQRAYRSKVKSPADFVVGTVRMLGVRAAPQELANAMRKLGQAILEPPNVAGWKGERAWITSATWLLRANFVAQLFGGSFKTRPTAERLLSQKTPSARADAAIELLLDGDVPVDARQVVRDAAQKNANPASILHTVLCLPEGQLL